ncbi:MAG: sigma-70 family RNA polymerase sigma factor [Anaerovoracaceae bacterium]
MIGSAVYERFTNEELLRQYKQTGQNDIKQELVIRYSYLVKAIAVQMRGVYLSFAEVDDIINEGIIALMQAIEKFDFSRNVKLETYASLRIKGTIVDMARKQDWIPRSIRKKAKEIDRASMELYEKNGVMPGDSEVAEYMGIPLEKFHKIQGEMNLYNVISLDSIISDYKDSFNVTPLSGQQGPDDAPAESLQKKEMSQVLEKAVRGLSEREQLIISLYYGKEMSMKDISMILEVSEPRVSQLHSSAIRKLRTVMQSYAAQ